MPTAFFPQFSCIYRDVAGVRVIVQNVTFNVTNITTSTSLGTKISDAEGIIVEGSFTGASINIGDIIEFTHGTYTGKVRFTLQATQAEAYTAAENDALIYLVQDDYATIINSPYGEIYALDTATPTKPPEYIGRAKAGATNRFPYQSQIAKTLKLILVPQDESLQYGNQDLTLAPNVNLNVPATSISIGTRVTGGGANRVLFLDGSQNLASDVDFSFDSANNRLTVGSAILQTPNLTSLFLGSAPSGSYSGSVNIFLGFQAGDAVTTGTSNCFIGDQAGTNTTTGSGNVFTGVGAGLTNVSGAQNTYVGASAGSAATSSNNVMVGRSAGVAVTSGGAHTLVGEQAGSSLTTASGCVFLGWAAGFSETNSNRLYIENSTSATPLIYGEFDNDLVRINGKFVVRSTTQQSSIEYNASNRWDITVSSTGGVTFDAVGSGAKFIFSDNVEIASGSGLSVPNGGVSIAGGALSVNATGGADITLFSDGGTVSLASGTGDSFLIVNDASLNQWHAHPNVLMLDTANAVQLGDYQAFANNTHIEIDDDLNGGGAASFINIHCHNGIIKIGDVSGTANSTVLEITDSGPHIKFSGTGVKFGAFGATPVSKPTVTGSRGGNAALASLLTGLANLGWITDSST